MAAINLKDRHVLLDTNVLIGIYKHEEAYARILGILSDAKLHYSSASEFEFLRAGKSLEEQTEMLEHLARFNKIEINDLLIRQAGFVAGLYARAKMDAKPSMIDVVNATLAVNGGYLNHEEWWLVTTDRNDYPTRIFDWEHIEVVDLGNSANPEMVVFMRANIERFTKKFSEWSGSQA